MVTSVDAHRYYNTHAHGHDPTVQPTCINRMVVCAYVKPHRLIKPDLSQERSLNF